MSSSAGAVYANALYDAAEAAGRLKEVQRDLASFARGLAESPELARAIFNPAFDREAKGRILKQVTGTGDPLVGAALLLMLKNNRLHEIAEMSQSFSERYGLEQHELAVTLTTAVPIDDELAGSLRDKLAEATGQTITMRRVVDPTIIGGVVLRVRDLLIDASVRRRLDGLGRSLRAARLPAS